MAVKHAPPSGESIVNQGQTGEKKQGSKTGNGGAYE